MNVDSFYAEETQVGNVTHDDTPYSEDVSEYAVVNDATFDEDRTVMDWLTAVDETPVVGDVEVDGWIPDWSSSAEAETELINEQLENEGGLGGLPREETNEGAALNDEAIPHHEMNEENDQAGRDIRM